MAARAGGGEVEPFVSECEILGNAVPFVIQQSEHGLREGISLNRTPGIEIGGGIIGLRFAKAMFVKEAEQPERPGVSTLRQRRQFADRANVVAAGIGRRSARQCVGMRDWRNWPRRRATEIIEIGIPMSMDTGGPCLVCCSRGDTSAQFRAKLFGDEMRVGAVADDLRPDEDD
jgi:hypothetical protein